MNKNEFVLKAVSLWGADLRKIIESYPVLQKYQIRTEYPYEDEGFSRQMIIVEDVIQFRKDIDCDVIITMDYGDDDNEIPMLMIYDDYIE